MTAAEPVNNPHRPPLTTEAYRAGQYAAEDGLPYEVLRDIIDLSLWVGQLMLQYGAESARVEETVHRVGTALGANWLDILVSPHALVITTASGSEFRTKVRRVPAHGVNMSVLDAINTLSHRLAAGEMDRVAARAELARIGGMHTVYNRWLVVAAVGLGCAAFSRLFGGDWMVFAITFLAAGGAQWVRQELARQRFNAFLVVIATAFTATLLSGMGVVLRLTPLGTLAMLSSVLLLVPGVHLINAGEDIVKGHFVTGITRGILGGLIALCIALGISLAITLLGVELA